MRFFIFLLAVLTAGPSLAQHKDVLSQSGGRYVFGQISEARRDQFMLDTATGRVWQITCMESNEKLAGMDKCVWTALTPVLYRHGESTYNVLPPPVPARR